MRVGFDGGGLASLNYAGTELLEDGRPRGLRVVFEESPIDRKSGYRQEKFEKVEETVAGKFGQRARRLECSYAWGRMALGYVPEPDRLKLELSLENTSRRPIADFSLDLLQLRFPSPPANFEKAGQKETSSLDRLAVLELDFRRFKLLACCDSVYPPVHFGLGKPPERGGRAFPLVVRGGVYVPEPGGCEVYPHGLPRIAAGETLRLTFSLRFVPAGGERDSALADLYEKFRRFHAPGLTWRDRRPIGALFLPSDRSKRTEGNPRGWFGDKSIDITTKEGKALLRRRMLEFADRSVAVLKEMDAQGMIVWDIEGEEHPQITYVGDPRMLRVLAPEVDAIADEFFKKFLDAGLRTGVCIRPTQVYFNKKTGKWSHGTGSHGPQRNPLGDSFSGVWPRGLPWWRFYPVAERMSRKIAYARKRWGCSLFYVDTNGVFRQVGEEQRFVWMLLNANMWKRLRQKHPEVLLIPELHRDKWTDRVAQWAYTAAYLQPPYSSARTPDQVRRLLPGAFSVCYAVNLSPADLEKRRGELVEGVRGGDILFFRAWFRDRMNEKVKSIYGQARAGRPKP